ncbi:NUDIX domain-containing protein [Actinoplanes sp. HUAS TT8]|uniref:NUDIX domain-containing protein n=1 Tax=Actinoplanes sp. HUAS TT8 TaxID=3447453 RepID=UPI003F528C6C
MSDPHRPEPSSEPPPLHPVDVFLLLAHGDRILLALRQNTGYADNQWNCPSGKLEHGEDAITGIRREAAEEIGVRFEGDEPQFVGVVHHRSAWHARIGLIFAAAYDPVRHGVPINGEPHKCGEVRWFGLDEIPENTYPYTVAAIDAWRAGTRLQLSGWQ